MNEPTFFHIKQIHLPTNRAINRRWKQTKSIINQMFGSLLTQFFSLPLLPSSFLNQIFSVFTLQQLIRKHEFYVQFEYDVYKALFVLLKRKHWTNGKYFLKMHEKSIACASNGRKSLKQSHSLSKRSIEKISYNDLILIPVLVHIKMSCVLFDDVTATIKAFF